MNLANAVTAFRIVVSPIFFAAALLPSWSGRFHLLSLAVLWTLFVLIELSDLLDGMVARSLGIVSDMGKLLDPFADVISRLTYFVVFVSLDLVPGWIFLLIMYREFAMIFLRMMLLQRGIALAARGGGKSKAVLYAITGGTGILLLNYLYLGWPATVGPHLQTATAWVFGAAAALSWISFLDYLRLFLRLQKQSGE